MIAVLKQHSWNVGGLLIIVSGVVGAIVTAIFVMSLGVVSESAGVIDGGLLLPQDRQYIIKSEGEYRVVEKGAIFVRPVPALSDSDISELANYVGAESERKISPTYWLFRFSDDTDLATKSSELAKLDSVLSTELNDAIAPFFVPNDYDKLTVDPGRTDTTSAYWLDAINAPVAWDVTKGSEDVVVGMVDTPVDVTHPDLKGKVETLTKEKGTPHGTMVAGVIAAATNNDRGISSVGYATKIIAANGGTTVASMIEALNELVKKRVRVINISMGTPFDNVVLHDVIFDMYINERTIIVAAVGNCGNAVEDAAADTQSSACFETRSYNLDGDFPYSKNSTVMYPAAYNEVVGVTALTDKLTKATFATGNVGAEGNYALLSAPGVNVVTTYPGGKYVLASGTSISSAVVSGVAALMVSAAKSTTPLPEFIETLETTAQPDYVSRYGLVDAAAVVSRVANVVTPTPDYFGPTRSEVCDMCD
ncbi:S8 family serine peptidase [candidate division WWE3 bacterium]|uniref:S8 family serine peptidase n=1 Tax=candidate division WWE3 bacterium TaxID=2053526 RepID=A0A955LJP7_UNCKA|nr:S8 family serine peptidase [candidate division WWE3 bacterium]